VVSFRRRELTVTGYNRPSGHRFTFGTGSLESASKDADLRGSEAESGPMSPVFTEHAVDTYLSCESTHGD
jgi:hypothetical protein